MSKRIFIAADISEEAREKVFRYISNLREEFSQIGINWEKSKKLHLTLKFLGTTDEQKLNKIENIVPEIAGEVASFRLRIQNTGVFPSTKKARILRLDVFDEKKILMEINHRLEDECEKIGFAGENRKYVPHLTIARIKELQNAKDLIAKHLQTKFEPVEFKVSEIVVYESELQKTGSIYKIISKHKLK